MKSEEYPMEDRIAALLGEVVRLGKALDILVQTLRIQRLSLEQRTEERDALRAELDAANAKITCLTMAIQEMRVAVPSARILPFAPTLVKKTSVH